MIHTYYTVALAPAIAALVAIGGWVAWRERRSVSARFAVAAAVLLTSAWSWALLDRSPEWKSWLRVLIPVSVALAALCLLAARRRPAMRRARGRRRRRVRRGGLHGRAGRLLGRDDRLGPYRIGRIGRARIRAEEPRGRWPAVRRRRRRQGSDQQLGAAKRPRERSDQPIAGRLAVSGSQTAGGIELARPGAIP